MLKGTWINSWKAKQRISDETWAFASRHVDQTKHLKDNNRTTHKIRIDVCTVVNKE